MKQTQGTAKRMLAIASRSLNSLVLAQSLGPSTSSFTLLSSCSSFPSLRLRMQYQKMKQTQGHMTLLLGMNRGHGFHRTLCIVFVPSTFISILHLACLLIGARNISSQRTIRLAATLCVRQHRLRVMTLGKASR